MAKNKEKKVKNIKEEIKYMRQALLKKMDYIIQQDYNENITPILINIDEEQNEIKKNN